MTATLVVSSWSAPARAEAPRSEIHTDARPAHDDRLMAFLRQHAKNFHAGQENGNSKHDHRHWQIAAEFRLINDKSTATEMQDRIGEAIGLHKGHVPKRNIVVRICQGEEDAFNMLGYVQKEKNRVNSYE